MTSTASDSLLTPFSIGSLTLRNRIVSTSHEPAYTDEGMPGDRYRAYHAEKARGGVGLTMIGGSAIVARDSPAAFGNIDLSTDEVVPWLAKFSDEIHGLGTKVMIQVTHLGARSSNFTGDWLPLVSSSRYREPAHRAFAKEAEDWDIDRIIDDYASAAKRVADGGLDGLELQHWGHLMDSFVSPWLNHRDDEYGGSLENRLRFPLRLIDAVRAAVPDDFILGVRMSMDQMRDDGLDSTAAIAILQRYIEHGVQFVSITGGRIESDRALSESIPGMGTPSAPFLELCRTVRSAVSIPVLHATRIADVPTARHAVDDGCVDLVGMTRAQIADPYLVEKMAAGEEDDIRPCVGANACLDAIYVSGSAHCIHNPATGREETLPQRVRTLGPARRSRRVVIVGAGPAGLEAARVCAMRGHDVTLLEASDRHGGQVAIAARSERRRDLIGIVDWRLQQVRKNGVDVRFNVLADEDTVLALDPDVVLVATGGIPNTDVCAGEEHVLDVWDVMTSPVASGQRVLVYDDHGYYPAVDAVERLARGGAEVTYASPERTIAVDVGSMNSPAYLRMMAEHGVASRLTERLVAVEETDTGLRARLRSEYADTDTHLDVDAVVVDHGTLPNDELYLGLRAASLNGGAVDYDALVDPLGTLRSQALTAASAAEVRQPVREPVRQPAREPVLAGAGGPAAAAAEAPVTPRTAAGLVRPGTAPDAAGYELFRIGDATTGRNVHAAILDALRLSLLV
ncbi:MAG TPA: FAD-dependent oxidoreductase [Brevibacterium sp.]|nr:FAD-dependent oxidoreductase [Brevibacterium sp.]